MAVLFNGTLSNDTLLGSIESDLIFGFEGNDILTGTAGNDTVFGGVGSAIPVGNTVDIDQIQGGFGDDLLLGNQGSDRINGDDGSDTIYGGKDDDIIDGGAGEDWIFGDLGADTLTGGAGADRFVLGRRSTNPALTTGGSTIEKADVITDFVVGEDILFLEGGLTFADLRIISGTGAFAGDTIYQDSVTGDFLAVIKGIAGSTLISTFGGQVGSVDSLTGIFKPLAVGVPTFTDIAISNDGRLFGNTFSELYQINLGAGTTSLVGGFASNNVLYGAGGSNFYTVDPLTGKATLIANLGANFRSSGDLYFDRPNNRFLATSGATGGDILYSITLEGQATAIGSIGFRDVFGLTVNRQGNLIGYTDNGQQIRIDPTTGNGTLIQNVTGQSGLIAGATEFGI
jgi:RTX calcium-binding nonapeptide repeat (4 copies)